MHNIIHAILLGILQGFTEFLPVSSSAHLILVPKIMGWQDFGLVFDVAMHVGSLFAIISYFIWDQNCRTELKKINFFKLAVLIGIATVPVGYCGLLFSEYIAQHTRSLNLIAATTIIFGLLLGGSYYYHGDLARKAKDPNQLLTLWQMSIKQAVIIGLFQAIAIIPGCSRSGLTLTAGLFLGFNLLSASRISFILSIPVILAAGAKQAIELFTVTYQHVDLLVIATGFFSSMLASFIFIFSFFKYISKIGIWPFVIYRVLLGICLISC